jgi:putative spermidine/putrescine transport system substrate-binding protein
MLRTLIVTVATAAFTTGAFAGGHSELLGKSWDDIVAQAKEEGQVSWFVWYFQPRYREVAEAFTAEYGIEVVIPEGTHEGNIEKFLAERKRDTGDIDVLAMGTDRIDLFDPTEIAMGPLNDVLPEAPNMRTELGGHDGMHYAYGYWGNQTGIAYDPDKISEEELPQSVDDFAKFFAERPGEFGFNYENGGSGPSFHQNITRNIIGAEMDAWLSGEVTEERMAALQPSWDWFLEHSDGYVITASNTDSLQRLSGSEFTMVAGWEDHLYGLQVKGEVSDRIKFYIPEFGMNGGGNFNIIPANAPHPAAALVFLNWVSSAETQTAFNQVFGAAPMHPEADDSKSLVPNEMRKYSTIWPGNPFNTEIRQAFVENVVLER